MKRQGFQAQKIKSVLRYDTLNIDCVYQNIANNLGLTRSKYFM